MNLTSPSQVRSVLEQEGIRPSKTRGQNFLIDQNILDIIINAAELKKEDEVLEVGPGLGVVTFELNKRVKRVVAVEKDRKLFSYLQRSCESTHGIDLICADALDILEGKDEPSGVLSSINKMVSNLPYASGSRMLAELAMMQVPMEQLVVTVQLEVARRIASASGGSDYGVLAVWTQLYYDVELVKIVSPTCFWPRPEVKSGILKLTRHKRVGLKSNEREMFYYLTKQAFSHRRKQLVTILSSVPGKIKMSHERALKLLDSLGLNVKARPENLAVDDWCALVRAIEGKRYV